MKPTTVHLERYESMHGWANRILRIDLSDMRVWAKESAPYLPAYLGARGVAARICWDEYPEPVGEFDPANPLMVMTGALTGSRSPYSGRTNVCAFSPQAHPYHWFTRSSIGGRFGGELKRAGYDGIVVTGASETPVQVRIRDDEVSVLPADELWGLDIMDTLEALAADEGKGVRSLVIGPAGERLSRIATIQTASSSAAGQGGFGGVMGSKKLKAISVMGTGRVSLATPSTMTSLARAIAAALADKREMGVRGFGGDTRWLNQQLDAEGNGRVRCEACTEGCVTPCAAYFEDVPGVAHNRKWDGAWFCVSAILGRGRGEDEDKSLRSAYDWHLERRAAFEMNVLSNRYGLNQFDILAGMVPWLIACQKSGLISKLNGQAMDWRSPEFWAEFLHATAYREGLGDALAEGGRSAAHVLRLGEDLARARYPGWGCAAHWDGREGHQWPFFPYWVVPAVQWLADTRDPFNNGHASLKPAGVATRLNGASSGAERDAIVSELIAYGERIYHDADATDPTSGYKAKGYPAFFHSIRSMILDCVPADDFTLPLLWSENTPDHSIVLRDIDGVGDVEGPSAEYHLFRAGTGLSWSEQEFEHAVQRPITLERALQVRHWGRDRQMDETVLPYFERTEVGQNPLLGKRYGLDREQFKPVLDEFYSLHGWDTERGWPTPERLRALHLTDVHGPMVQGAAEAKERQPVLDSHFTKPERR